MIDPEVNLRWVKVRGEYFLSKVDIVNWLRAEALIEGVNPGTAKSLAKFATDLENLPCK